MIGYSVTRGKPTEGNYVYRTHSPDTGNQKSAGVHADSCGSEKGGDEHGELRTFMYLRKSY